MYTVLLTDDEISVTESLKKDVLWPSLGVSSILTANDGLQALEIIKSSHVDLLITDIRMPRMSGLELLKIVRQDFPQIHCILLTAYSEFNYAMQALKLGVDSYLLKPMQIQELTETIENTLDNIYIHRGNREALFQENILRRWIAGNISSDELGEKTVFLNINIYQSEYSTIVIKKRNASVSISAFDQECAKLLSPNYEYASVWDNSGNFVILIGGSNIILNHVASVLCQIVQQFGISGLIHAAIGKIVSDRNDVHSSYQSALNLITANHSEQYSGILIFEEKEPDNSKSIFNLDTQDLSPIVLRAIEYIKENYAQGLSIKEFCNNININAAYLGYLFKKETGMFFNNYLLEYRLEKAIDLLCFTGEKIADIATMTGYATTSHFIVNFKKKTGFSPLKYREIYGGKK